MKRIHHLIALVESIKKTDEMIALHKNDELKIMAEQYENIKVRQVAEFIDELAKSPYQSVESLSVIKLMIDKYYPFISSDTVAQKELKQLALAI